MLIAATQRSLRRRGTQRGFPARDIDWTASELVERIPGKVSGHSVVRGTRILADTIVEGAELGSPLEEIHENYPDLSPVAIRQLVVFAQSHRVQRVP